MRQKPSTNSQLDKFKQAAKEAECNPDEDAFDEALKKISTVDPTPESDDKTSDVSREG